MILPAQSIDIAAYIDAGGSFEDAEALVAVYSPQLWTGGGCVIHVPIKSTLFLLKWAPGDARWISISLADEALLGVLIPPDPDRPAARYYFSFVEREGLEVIRQHMTHIVAVDGFAALEAQADPSGFEARVQEHRSDSLPLQEQLAAGRAVSTKVTETHILETGGRCLVCNAVGHPGSTVSTTIGTSNAATSIIVTLCDAHKKEASEQFLIEFLAEKFGFNLPVKVSNVDSARVLKWIEQALLALECEDLMPDEKKCQITGTRKSGFKLILRCEAHIEKNSSKKKSYAYMVLTPNGSNVRRIDDTKDHPEQQIRWDHVHLGLPKNNKLVAPSFTFGQPNFDLPAIRIEIEKAEAAWLI